MERLWLRFYFISTLCGTVRTFFCVVKSIFYSLLFFKIQNVGGGNLELLIDILNFKVKDSFQSSIKPWKNYTSFNLAFNI